MSSLKLFRFRGGRRELCPAEKNGFPCCLTQNIWIGTAFMNSLCNKQACERNPLSAPMTKGTEPDFHTLHKKDQGSFPKEPSPKRAVWRKSLLFPSRVQCISKRYLAKIAAEPKSGSSQGKCHCVGEPATSSLAEGSSSSIWSPLPSAKTSSMTKHDVEVLCSREQRRSRERTPKFTEYRAVPPRQGAVILDWRIWFLNTHANYYRVFLFG